MKRFACIVIAFALVMVPIVPARAESIYFVALNDSIPAALSSSTMPYYYNSLVYIPCVTFNKDEMGVDLGVYYSLDASGNILTLYSLALGSAKHLAFDLNSGTVTDENNIVSEYAAVRSASGTLYIPASFVCAHFGLGFSYLSASQNYPMVRITNGKEKMTDDGFIEKSKNLVDTQAAKYLSQAQETQNPPPQVTPSTNPSDQPIEDPPEETDNPEPSGEPTETLPYVPRELTVCAIGVNNSTVNWMDTYPNDIAFFLRLEDLNSGERVRRLVCGGYMLGAAVDMSGAEAALASFEAINDMMKVVVKTKTLLVCPEDLQNVSADAVEALEQLGCVVWQYGIELGTDYFTVGNYEDGINIFFYGDLTTADSAHRAAQLAEFLKNVSDSEDRVNKITEVTQPPDKAYEILISDSLSNDFEEGAAIVE